MINLRDELVVAVARFEQAQAKYDGDPIAQRNFAAYAVEIKAARDAQAGASDDGARANLERRAQIYESQQAGLLSEVYAAALEVENLQRQIKAMEDEYNPPASTPVVG